MNKLKRWKSREWRRDQKGGRKNNEEIKRKEDKKKIVDMSVSIDVGHCFKM